MTRSVTLESRHRQRTLVQWGVWILVGLIVTLGVWAVMAPINSAVVAQGVVILHNQTKKIQHPTGGVVTQLHVEEGAAVSQGDPLITLDGTLTQANYTILIDQFWSVWVQECRLLIERRYLSLDPSTTPKHAPVLTLSKLLNDLPTQIHQDPFMIAGLPTQNDVLTTQQQLLITQQTMIQTIHDIYHQKQRQLDADDAGIHAQWSAADTSINILNTQLSKRQGMEALGYSTEAQVSEKRLELEAAIANRSQLASQITKLNQQRLDAKSEWTQTQSAFLSDIESELQQTQLKRTELQERLAQAKLDVQRAILTAPQSGIVKGLQVHTLGAVIAPGQPICEIVPQKDDLVIEATVNPQDIDLVQLNQLARVRLTAYKSKTIPPLNGYVILVSPDRFTDTMGRSYYTARIKLDPAQLDAYPTVALYPGMPAQVLLITGSRTFLQYLLYPITNALDKSLRSD